MFHLGKAFDMLSKAMKTIHFQIIPIFTSLKLYS
jgi:hypothetical protein